MSDYLFAAIGPTERSAHTQWENFALDPRGDGSITWLVPEISSRTFKPTGNLISAPGVMITPLRDDNGSYLWGVRVHGLVLALEDNLGLKDHESRIDEFGKKVRIRNTKTMDQFKTNGLSGKRLLERKRDDQVYASGLLEVLQWRNIILMKGVGSLDDEIPDELVLHTWL